MIYTDRDRSIDDLDRDLSDGDYLDRDLFDGNDPDRDL